VIVLEHTLVILLLLVGLLNARPKIHRYIWWLMAIVVLVSLFLPSTPLQIPWDLLSALLMPILLWQVIGRLANANMRIRAKELLIWLGLAFGIGAILVLVSGLNPASSFTLGLLFASMVWRASAEKKYPTLLGQVGPLALALLLTEIAPAVEAPGQYAVALLGGISLGLILSFIAVQFSQKIINSAAWQNVLAIGQIYLAYLVSISFGFSGIAAAISAIVFFVAYSVKKGICPGGTVGPDPLSSPPIYAFGVLSLSFLAWQTHIPLTRTLMVEVILILLVTIGFTWIGQRVSVKPFLTNKSNYKILLRIAALLVPTVMLWPREASISTLPLLIALAVSAALIYGTRKSITPILDLYAWIEKVGQDKQDSPAVSHRLRGKDILDQNHPVILSTASVRELVDVFLEGCWKCLPVVDEKNKLLGMVSDYDIFVREERLPRSGTTYQALFKEPIDPDFLVELYAEKALKYKVEDVMTTKVITVQDTDSMDVIIQKLVQYNLTCIPVLAASSENNQSLAGVITRSGILRLILQSNQTKRTNGTV